MRGIDAQRSFAKVVDRQSGGDRSDVELVRRAVCPMFSPPSVERAHIEQPVSVRVLGAGPDPAPVAASNLGVESLSNVSRLRPTLHPTDFTEFVGRQLLAHLGAVAA